MLVVAEPLSEVRSSKYRGATGAKKVNVEVKAVGPHVPRKAFPGKISL